MKSEEIKRIAEIIGLDFTFEDIQGEMAVFYKPDALYQVCFTDVKAVEFRPDKYWQHTGVLLEWLHKNEYEVDIMHNGDGDVWIVIDSYNWEPDNNFHDDVTGKDLQEAICKAVLAVGGEG